MNIAPAMSGPDHVEEGKKNDGLNIESGGSPGEGKNGGKFPFVTQIEERELFPIVPNHSRKP